jgi:hypothetical protein
MTKVQGNQGYFVLHLFISLYYVLQMNPAKISGNCAASANHAKLLKQPRQRFYRLAGANAQWS